LLYCAQRADVLHGPLQVSPLAGVRRVTRGR